MAVEVKKIALSGTVGVLIAVLIIAGVSMIPGVKIPSVTANTGTLIVKLTDRPVNLTHLNVTIDGLRVQRENETWHDLTFVGGVSEVYVDLLALENVTMDLSITYIPTGNYTMIAMHISTANATYAEGGTVDLIVPSGEIKVIIHFEIGSGGTTIVLIDMNADFVAISKSNRLRPVLKATVI